MRFTTSSSGRFPRPSGAQSRTPREALRCESSRFTVRKVHQFDDPWGSHRSMQTFCRWRRRPPSSLKGGLVSRGQSSNTYSLAILSLIDSRRSVLCGLYLWRLPCYVVECVVNMGQKQPPTFINNHNFKQSLIEIYFVVNCCKNRRTKLTLQGNVGLRCRWLFRLYCI